MNLASRAPRRPLPLAVLTVLTTLLAGLAVVGYAGPASAVPCNPDDPGCSGGSTVTTYSATLSVTRTGGTPGSVTSDAPNGHALDCGTTCSVTDSQTTLDTDGPPSTWWTYTLTASGPSGYRPQWTGCDVVDAQQRCVVTNEDWSQDTVVAVGWYDAEGPLITFDPPARVGPATLLTAHAVDNSGSVREYRWMVDGVMREVGPGYFSAQGLSAGAHTVAVAARDYSGNESSWVSRTVQMDAAVGLAVGDLPAYTDGSAPVTLSFSTDEDVPVDDTHRQCRVGTGSYGACTTASTFTLPVDASTPDGTYRLEVRATDDVGNVATASRETVLDRAAPQVLITGGPAEGSTMTTPEADLTFDVQDATPAGATCWIDGLTPVDCSSGTFHLQHVPDGARTVTVQASDQLGHTTTVVRHFDRVRLDADLGVAVGPTVYGTPATFSFTLPGSATGTVVVKHGGDTVCTAEITSGAGQCSGGARLQAGDQSLTAQYSGDDTFGAAVALLSTTWSKASTSTSAHPAKAVVKRHHAAMLVAEVTPHAPGRVVFREKGHTLCSAKVVRGVAACSTSTRLAAGVHKVVASYGGSTNYLASRGRTSFRIR